MATLDDLTGKKPDENMITLDDITGQFKTKTQRQSYYELDPEHTSDLDPDMIDPDKETTAADFTGVWSPERDAERTISPERARRTGERIARVIDTGFNFFVSNLVAKGSGKEYKADADDLADIAEAWGDIAEEKQWEFSPGWQLAILYAIVYGPLAKEAFNDRRLAEVETRQNTLEDKIKALENELARSRQYEAAEAARKATAETKAEA